MKQILELKQTQKLSPLQIQTIKLIETPFQELRERVRSEWESNPVLDDEHRSEKDDDDEEDQPKDVSIEEVKENDDPIPGYMLSVRNWGNDERPQYDTFSVKDSFTQNLMDQLGFQNLSEHEMEVARFIIGSLDDDGYLRRDTLSLVDDLAFRAGIETDEEEVLRLLGIIQTFEPYGVGARDLRECLLLQIAHEKHTPEVIMAESILRDMYQDFVGKHYDKICSRKGLTPQELKAALKKILRLNPSPGGQIDDSYNDRAQQVIPDFHLSIEDGVMTMTMPRFKLPEIRVKKKYSEILEDARTSTDREVKDAAVFVKQRIDSAKWFLEALKQRQNTLETTMNAILEYQKEYFLEGDDAYLKPMVLKDIAERTGFDISTISRVANSKYIETPFGIFPLKYFFSEGMENKDGDEISTRELKKALRELVDSEDKNSPLTDDALVVEMGKKGYKLARRTVAKYRDQLGIPKARLRRGI